MGIPQSLTPLISVKVVSELICDRCGLHVVKGDYEYSEFICIEHRCGYGSILEDGKLVCIDICQRCFVDSFDEDLRLNERSQSSWTSFFEGKKVSDDFMVDRIDIISEKGAASGILKNIKTNQAITDEDSLNDSIDE